MLAVRLRLIASLLVSLTMMAQGAVAQDMQPKIPVELKVFDFLLGDWKTKVEFYDLEGAVRYEREFSNTVAPTVQGVIYRGESGLLDKSKQFGETWYLYDQLEKKHRIISTDTQGNFDVFNGVILDDRLVFTNSPKPWPNGKDIIWRRIYFNIEEGAHEVIMEYSFDYGYSWVKANHWVREKL